MSKKVENWGDMDDLLIAIRDAQQNNPRRNRVQERAKKAHDRRIIRNLSISMALVVVFSVIQAMM